MRFPKFTIVHLLAIVMYLAVGFAALRFADRVWESGLFGATLLILLVSILLAVNGVEGRRAYWLGFALFGWAYLIMACIPSIEERLPTTQGIHSLYLMRPIGMKNFSYLDFATGTNTPPAPYTPRPNTRMTEQDGYVRVWDTKTGMLIGGSVIVSKEFDRIGHSLVSAILAFIGGSFSNWIRYSRKLVDETTHR